MAKNPHTGNKENKEKILQNLYQKAERTGMTPSLRQQIQQNERYLADYARKEKDWNRNH